MITERRNKRFEDVLSKRTNDITVVLDGVRNYHNIAAVLRSCDAFGINEAYAVSDNTLEFCSSVSKGSQKWVKLNPFSDAGGCVDSLKKSGFKIVCVQSKEESDLIDRESIPVSQVDFSEKLAFVYGNEHKGVSRKFQDACDYCVHIDMLGFVESLNISVACAIVLYSSTVGKGEGVRHPKTLTDSEVNEQKLSWVKREVGREVPDNLLKEYEYKNAK